MLKIPLQLWNKSDSKSYWKLWTWDMSFPVATTLHEKHCHKCTLKSDRALLTGSLTWPILRWPAICGRAGRVSLTWAWQFTSFKIGRWKQRVCKQVIFPRITHRWGPAGRNCKLETPRKVSGCYNNRQREQHRQSGWAERVAEDAVATWLLVSAVL